MIFGCCYGIVDPKRTQHRARGGGYHGARHTLLSCSNIVRCFACVQVSCIYGLGMPSKYLEASIRIVVGQEWEGGWRALAQHLEQVTRHAGASVLHTPHACLFLSALFTFHVLSSRVQLHHLLVAWRVHATSTTCWCVSRPWRKRHTQCSNITQEIGMCHGRNTFLRLCASTSCPSQRH